MSRIAVLLAVSSLIVVACDGGAAPAPMAAATTAAATQAAAQTSAVTIQGFSFGPPAIGVSVGTTVTWTNRDGTTHTVTSGTLPGAGNPSGTPDGKFDQMVDGQGGTFTFTFPQAGTVTYFCRFHSNMRASVEVR